MIACLGDNLTYGFGLRPRGRWIDIVRNRGYDINNCGVNGARIRDIMARIQENPLPDYVSVMGDTSDFDSGGSVESPARTYLEIDSCLTSQEVQSIHETPTPTSPKIAEYKNLSNKLSFFHDELLLTFPRDQLVDFFHAFTPYDSNLFFDKIHPNKESSRKMAEVSLKEWSFQGDEVEKLLGFLETTTRRERTLPIVFLCVILVFLYLQFLARPLEDAIHAQGGQETSQVRGLNKRYTGKDASPVLHKVQANPQVQNYQEPGRSFAGRDHLTMEVNFSLSMKRNRLASFIRFLERDYEVQEEKVEVKRDLTNIKVKIHFPLRFRQISQKDSIPGRVQVGRQEQTQGEAKGLAIMKTKNSNPTTGQNPSPIRTQVRSLGQGETSKTKAQEISHKSLEKKAAKPKAKVKELSLKAQKIYQVMDQEQKLETTSLWSQELLNTERNIDFKSLDLEGPKFLNPILRIEEDLTFSCLNERGKEGILSLTFEPVGIENLLLACQVAGPSDTWVLYIKDGRKNSAFLWDKEAWSGQWVYGLNFRVQKQDFVDIIEIKAYQ